MEIPNKMSVIICMGQDLNEDGSLPNTLMNRIDAVCNLIARAKATYQKKKLGVAMSSREICLPICIVFSGYITKGCAKSQSQVMWEYFNRKMNFGSVDFGNIQTKKNKRPTTFITVNTLLSVVLEERAQNTVETFAYCSDIFEELFAEPSNKPSAIYLVTCDFHCPRTVLLGNHLLGHIGHCVDVPVSSFQAKKPKFSSTSSSIDEMSSRTDTSYSSRSQVSVDSIRSHDAGDSEDIMARLSQCIYVERRRLSKINRFLEHYDFPLIPEQAIIAAMQRLDEFERSFLQFI